MENITLRGVQANTEKENYSRIVINEHFGMFYNGGKDRLNFMILTERSNAQTLGTAAYLEEIKKPMVLVLKLFHLGNNNQLLKQQVCIIQGKNFVLSFFEDENSFFNDVVTAIKGNILKIRNRESDYLLSVLLNDVMANYRNVISTVEDSLEEMESRMLTITTASDIGIKIQESRRQYLRIKRAVLPLKDQFSKLILSDSKLLHKTNRIFFSDVNDHLQFVLQTIEICRETLSSLVDLYISNNDLRMNDIMKRLTVVSTIFIPLTFLVGVWGMRPSLWIGSDSLY